jgi:hypothetical protein
VDRDGASERHERRGGGRSGSTVVNGIGLTGSYPEGVKDLNRGIFP